MVLRLDGPAVRPEPVLRRRGDQQRGHGLAPSATSFGADYGVRHRRRAAGRAAGPRGRGRRNRRQRRLTANSSRDRPGARLRGGAEGVEVDFARGGRKPGSRLGAGLRLHGREPRPARTWPAWRLGVGDHAEAAHARDVRRRAEHVRLQPGGLGRVGVHVRHRDIAEPVGARALGQGLRGQVQDAGEVVVAVPEDPVDGRGAAYGHLAALGAPAEDRRVEFRPGRRVGAQALVPAEHMGRALGRRCRDTLLVLPERERSALGIGDHGHHAEAEVGGRHADLASQFLAVAAQAAAMSSTAT